MSGRAFLGFLFGIALFAGIYWGAVSGRWVVSIAQFDCGEGGQAQGSAQYLRQQAHCIYGDGETAAVMLRLTLINDIYIKAQSYSLLNRVCFWSSILLAILVLIYPALGPILTPRNSPNGATPNWFQRAISTSSVQTSLTALAAASFAFYAHYKEQQSVAETLMRQLLIKETVDVADMEDVVSRMAQMDKGFGFGTSSSWE